MGTRAHMLRKKKSAVSGRSRNRTGDRRICNPMLYRCAIRPCLPQSIAPLERASPREKIKIKNKNTGAVRELNPRPLAPEARIIPLDQRPDRVHGAAHHSADGAAEERKTPCPAHQCRAPMA